jgi:cystathionine beta-lyase
VADLAERHDVLVLADEVHAPLTYPGTTHVPFGSLDHPAAQRSAMFVAASKAWNFPGLKTGLVLAGPLAHPDLAQLPWPVQSAAGLFGTIAAEAAFAEGEPWLTAVLDQLDDSRRLLGRLLGEQLPDVGYRMPDATYLAWLDCRGLGLGDDPAATFLERGRVALSHGHTFGGPGAGFARLNFATAQPILIDAVQRVAAATIDR